MDKEARAAALDKMVEAISRAADALADVDRIWKENLEPDAYTPESSYPFALSLDEQVEALYVWHDGVWQDAMVLRGQA